jgi:hypothetical protein
MYPSSWLAVAHSNLQVDPTVSWVLPWGVRALTLLQLYLTVLTTIRRKDSMYCMELLETDTVRNSGHLLAVIILPARQRRSQATARYLAHGVRSLMLAAAEFVRYHGSLEFRV